MKSRLPNVLLLTVDALRRDRMSLHGYGRPTTPVLESLADHALVCDRAVSPAAFTHISFPSLMTSSRPFDFGGYDQGVFQRPPTLFGAFNAAGYETHMLSTFQWVSSFQGYETGVDREYLLFVLNTVTGAAIASLRSSIAAWHDKRIDDAQAVDRTRPVLLKLFDSIEGYCAHQLTHQDANRHALRHTRLIAHRYDYRHVRNVALAHRARFLVDPILYLRTHLSSIPAPHEWISRDWHRLRPPSVLAGQALFDIFNCLLGRVDRDAAALRDHRYKRYIDSGAMADRIIDILRRRSPEIPFFLWTHLLDTHVPYCAGYGPKWFRQTPRYLERLGYPGTLNVTTGIGGRPRTDEEWETWSALYDAAVLYTDEQIGRIVEYLKQSGQLQDTLVVICGDHGEELGEHGDISHHFRLYSHNVCVPLIAVRDGMAGRRIDGLVDLLDLGPTLTDLAGIETPPEWRGRPVTSDEVARREHVLLETLHGGDCLFEHRPLYFAVRTDRYNYLWKEYRDPTDRFSPEGHQLYDIVRDPAETNNLYSPDHPAVAAFDGVIAARMAEMPEIASDRIARAHGAEAPGCVIPQVASRA